MNKIVGDLVPEAETEDPMKRVMEIRAQEKAEQKAQLKARQEAELAEARRLEEEAYQRRRQQGCDCTADRYGMMTRG